MTRQYEIFENPFEDCLDEAAAQTQIEYDQALHSETIVQPPMPRCPYTEEMPF